MSEDASFVGILPEHFKKCGSLPVHQSGQIRYKLQIDRYLR
jgi:hypothetical protein